MNPSLSHETLTRRSAAYAQRMNRVLDHIDAHLDTALDLPTLAAVAHFSAFHFHRVFAAFVGETLGDYLRRRRLEVAAILLIHQPQASVLDVALRVGFGSAEAFARAFKQHFAATPSQWRRDTPLQWAAEREALHQQRRNLDQGLSNIDQTASAGTAEDGVLILLEPSMQVQVRTLPATRVAYMRHIGPYGLSVNTFWRKQFYPFLVASGLETAPCYGIGHDDPAVTPAKQCRFDACVVVPEGFVPSGGANLMTVTGGRYAMADYTGGPEGIAEAWKALMRDWLPASGMRLDERHCFEYYPNTAEDRQLPPGTFRCQLCLPVCPL